jgi:hypothetical protein
LFAPTAGGVDGFFVAASSANKPTETAPATINKPIV